MIADFVLSLDGVATFSLPTWARDAEIRGTEAYFKRRAELKQQRVFFRAGAGTKGGSLEGVRDQLISQMRQMAGGRFQKEGVLCIFGSSNGAAHALAIAAALQNELTINYICLADLPMFTGGRPVPGVGTCDPSRPVTIRRASSLAGFREVHAVGDRPKVTLQPDINAKVKQNFYQHDGNSIKVGLLSGNWFWDSDMTNGEFHGMIGNSGWNPDQEITGLSIDNPRLRSALGMKGDAFHQVLDDHVENNIWGKRWPVELAKL